jgi:hypothetical protein
MGKIVRLTENDLVGLVNRVIKEQSKQGADLKTIKNLFTSKGYSFNPTGGYKLWGHKETTGPLKGKDGKYVWNYEVYIPSKPGNELWIDKRRDNAMGGRESENIIINLNGPQHTVKYLKNGKTINTQTLDLNGVSKLIQDYKASF